MRVTRSLVTSNMCVTQFDDNYHSMGHRIGGSNYFDLLQPPFSSLSFIPIPLLQFHLICFNIFLCAILVSFQKLFKYDIFCQAKTERIVACSRRFHLIFFYLLLPQWTGLNPENFYFQIGYYFTPRWIISLLIVPSGWNFSSNITLTQWKLSLNDVIKIFHYLSLKGKGGNYISLQMMNYDCAKIPRCIERSFDVIRLWRFSWGKKSSAGASKLLKNSGWIWKNVNENLTFWNLN